MADMRDTVNGFTGANTFVIVSVCIGVATINILQELSASPHLLDQAVTVHLPIIAQTIAALT